MEIDSRFTPYWLELEEGLAGIRLKLGLNLAAGLLELGWILQEA